MRMIDLLQTPRAPRRHGQPSLQVAAHATVGPLSRRSDPAGGVALHCSAVGKRYKIKESTRHKIDLVMTLPRAVYGGPSRRVWGAGGGADRHGRVSSPATEPLAMPEYRISMAAADYQHITVTRWAPRR